LLALATRGRYVLKGSGDYTELERTVEDKDVDVSTLDFSNGLENGYHGSHVLPVPKRGRKKLMKALKSHASSRVLPGDDAIRSAYHNLEEVRPVETDRFE